MFKESKKLKFLTFTFNFELNVKLLLKKLRFSTIKNFKNVEIFKVEVRI